VDDLDNGGDIGWQGVERSLRPASSSSIDVMRPGGEPSAVFSISAWAMTKVVKPVPNSSTSTGLRLRTSS
jgi:hypothetical protein